MDGLHHECYGDFAAFTTIVKSCRPRFPEVTFLETSRLRLRPLELADAEQTQILFPQWDIVRFLTKAVPWPYPPDGVLTYYRNIALPAMERGDAWHWTLRLKTSPNQLIGRISLLRSEEENRGFWLGSSVAASGSNERGVRDRD